METNNNYIDELVRNSLPDNEPSSNDAALWDRIDSTLKYKRFLRFSLNNFNIYYSIVIFLIVVSFVGYFLINNNSKNTTTENNCSKQPINTVKNNASSLPQNDKTIKPSVTSDKMVCGQNVQDKHSKKTNTYSLPVIKETENKTVSTENKEPKNAKKIKIVKKRLVITDTIRKKDTVFIKKQIAPK